MITNKAVDICVLLGLSLPGYIERSE
jgi:hypothetical protein